MPLNLQYQGMSWILLPEKYMLKESTLRYLIVRTIQGGPLGNAVAERFNKSIKELFKNERQKNLVILLEQKLK